MITLYLFFSYKKYWNNKNNFIQLNKIKWVKLLVFVEESVWVV